MSEYQYYEFRAVDRPLTKDEMREMRAVSSRGRITPGSFVNEYQWGDFKGEPSDWMERFFDGFLYLANWGTREVMLRVPRAALDLAAAQQYCRGRTASAWEFGDRVILAFGAEDENREHEWWDQADVDPHGTWSDDDEEESLGGTRLASLLPLRAELAAGDHRVLYLAWLLSVQSGDEDDDAPEPPVPPGLRDLTPAQQSFADFLWLDRDLLGAAATASADPPAPPAPEDAAAVLASIPAEEKDGLLARVLAGNGGGVRLELVRRVAQARKADPARTAAPRTAGELLEAADRERAERLRKKQAREAAEQARRARLEAEARERRLDRLAAREEDAWSEVDALIATRQPKRYDEAVALLADLRAVAARAGRAGEADARIQRLRETHARKDTLLRRMQRGLS